MNSVTGGATSSIVATTVSATTGSSSTVSATTGSSSTVSATTGSSLSACGLGATTSPEDQLDKILLISTPFASALA